MCGKKAEKQAQKILHISCICEEKKNMKISIWKKRKRRRETYSTISWQRRRKKTAVEGRRRRKKNMSMETCEGRRRRN